MPATKRDRAVRVDATGTAVGQEAMVTGVLVHTTTTAGSVVLRDGGSSGETVADYPTPAAEELVFIPVPGHLDFGTDVHVTLNNVNAAVVYWR